MKALAARRGPERVLDFMLRTGPYGDGFGADPDGLSLAKLEANPHGIDLGPLQPRIPEVLRTPTGMIELAPEIVRRRRRPAARPRSTARPTTAALVLVGRRDLRSNNSWMHNLDGAREGQAALHASTSTPTTRRGSASPTAPTCACVRRGRDRAARPRSPTRCMPAS